MQTLSQFSFLDNDPLRKATCKELKEKIIFDSVVVRGFQRGKTLGFATANLDIPNEQLDGLELGVYCGYASYTKNRTPLTSGLKKEESEEESITETVEIADKKERNIVMDLAVISIGTNPTFGNKFKTIEVHLLAEHTDFYGYRMRVIMTHFIRNVVKFNGIDDLILNIRKDCNIGKQLLASGKDIILSKEERNYIRFINTNHDLSKDPNTVVTLLN